MSRQRSKLHLIFFFFLCYGFGVEALAQQASNPFTRNLSYESPDSTFSFRVNPVVQNQVYVTHEEGAEQLSFRNRRTRFYMSGYVFDPRFVYKVQLRFEKNDQNLYDAAFKFSPNDRFTLWLGQETLPAARSQLVSLKYLQFVDRSIVHAMFDLQKDVGLWVFYDQPIGQSLWTLSGALSNGEGIFRPTHSKGLSYTLRLNTRPLGAFAGNGDTRGADIQFEPSAKVAIGIAYNFNDNATASRGQRGVAFPAGFTRDIHTVYVDGIFKLQGWSVMAEWISRSSPDKVLESSNPVFRGTGFSAQSGYMIRPTVDLALRYSVTSPRGAVTQQYPKQQDITLGLSKYFAGYAFKLQGDLSYYWTSFSSSAKDQERIQARVQISINF